MTNQTNWLCLNCHNTATSHSDQVEALTCGCGAVMVRNGGTPDFHAVMTDPKHAGLKQEAMERARRELAEGVMDSLERSTEKWKPNHDTDGTEALLLGIESVRDFLHPVGAVEADEPKTEGVIEGKE